MTRKRGALKTVDLNANQQQHRRMTTEEIIEAVKAIKPEEFKDALHKGAQGHYQEIFNAGHSTATASNKSKIEELEKLATDRDDLLTAKNAELADLASKKPDLDKIKTEYEEALVKKDEEWKARVEALESSVKGGKRDSLKQQLVNDLMGKHHVDEWAANRSVDEYLDRIKVEIDGSYKVYQKDNQTPYQPAEGQSSISLLASEIVGTIPDTLIRPPKNNGSDYKGGPKGNVSSTKKRSEMSVDEKTAFISEHGRAKFEALEA